MTGKRAVLAFVLAPGLAAASPTPMVHAPDGWRADAEQAAVIAKTVATSKPFGDPGATVAAEVYAPTSDAKISLVVTRATTRDAHLDRGTVALAAIDDVHAIVTRAKLAGAKPIEDSWDKGIAATDATLEASLAWHDPDAGTRDLARIVLAGDAATLVAVTGECLAGGDAKPELVAACKVALTTLDPGIARADRTAIPAPSPVPVPVPVPVPDPEAGTGTGTGRGTDHHPDLPISHMSDGSRVALPPMAIPQDPTSDRRPAYVGAGVVILALAFYWNRRNRERFLPEEEKPDDR